MRQLPILFSKPMVKAIQEDRKTMTRRTAGLEKVNENPDGYCFRDLVFFESGKYTFSPFNVSNVSNSIIECKPRYQVGDQLYVKETWCEPVLYDGCEKDYYYKADYPNGISVDYDSKHISGKWKPSLFMPKKAARIWLEVTEVRCERLKDITEADAIAEGIETLNVQEGIGYKNYTKINVPYWLSPQSSFFSLWILINGLDSLNSNPWLFVYTFKCIPKP